MSLLYCFYLKYSCQTIKIVYPQVIHSTLAPLHSALLSSARNVGFKFKVFLARLRISSLEDSADILTSSLNPPPDKKSLALSSAKDHYTKK